MLQRYSYSLTDWLKGLFFGIFWNENSTTLECETSIKLQPQKDGLISPFTQMTKDNHVLIIFICPILQYETIITIKTIVLLKFLM